MQPTINYLVWYCEACKKVHVSRETIGQLAMLSLPPYCSYIHCDLNGIRDASLYYMAFSNMPTEHFRANVIEISQFIAYEVASNE